MPEAESIRGIGGEGPGTKEGILPKPESDF